MEKAVSQTDKTKQQLIDDLTAHARYLRQTPNEMVLSPKPQRNINPALLAETEGVWRHAQVNQIWTFFLMTAVAGCYMAMSHAALPLQIVLGLVMALVIGVLVHLIRQHRQAFIEWQMAQGLSPQEAEQLYNQRFSD